MLTLKAIIRKDRENQLGECPLYIRITKNRRNSYVSLDRRIPKTKWDDSRDRARSSYHGAGRLNALIDQLKGRINGLAADLDYRGESYTAADLKRALTEGVDLDVISFAEEWTKGREEHDDISYLTHVKYQGTLSNLKDYSKGGFSVSEFTQEFVEDFESYLKTDLGNKKNTVASKLSQVKAIANELIRKGKLKVDDNPFKNIRIKREKGKREYLTNEERKAFSQVKLPEDSTIKKCQDIFLFCTYTGLRIGDALWLLKDEYDGERIDITIQKSMGKEISIPLLTEAKEIVDRNFNHSDSELIFEIANESRLGNEVAMMKEQKTKTALINKNLKIISGRAGIEKNISTHTARHTFAMHGLLSGELSLEHIKAVLGHENLKTTEIYGKASQELIDQAMSKLGKPNVNTDVE